MAKRPKLAVILGAGASHGVCPAGSGVVKNEFLKPPITETMFNGTALDGVLARHPEAAALMSSVRTEVAANVPFEESLRRYLDNTNAYIQRQLAFVPIALHTFFFLVSAEYTSEAINYSHLLNRTIGEGIHTAFMTVNYDTLLEMSLTRTTGVVFDSLQSYVSSPDWILVKLHGSVGWGYPWIEDGHMNMATDIGGDWARNLASHNPPPSRDPDLIRAGRNNFLYADGRALYPALALPVAGKYGFVCPPSHVSALKTFLADCENYLFIGFSANDQDLLDLLKETVRTARSFFTVTGGLHKESQAVAGRLMEAVPQFRGPYRLGAKHFGLGFTAYLGHREGLDYLVSALAH